MTDFSNKNARGDARVIAVRGAREHNLKNIDVDLPRDSLIVMTGLSGSGKSSPYRDVFRHLLRPLRGGRKPHCA
jgi:ABC-type proline/glycine betaine transport system ATPase subunit